VYVCFISYRERSPMSSYTELDHLKSAQLRRVLDACSGFGAPQPHYSLAPREASITLRKPWLFWPRKVYSPCPATTTNCVQFPGSDEAIPFSTSFLQSSHTVAILKISAAYLRLPTRALKRQLTAPRLIRSVLESLQQVPSRGGCHCY
jgi:hypothetical protein